MIKKTGTYEIMYVLMVMQLPNLPNFYAFKVIYVHKNLWMTIHNSCVFFRVRLFNHTACLVLYQHCLEVIIKHISLITLNLVLNLVCSHVTVETK